MKQETKCTLPAISKDYIVLFSISLYKSRKKLYALFPVIPLVDRFFFFTLKIQQSLFSKIRMPKNISTYENLLNYLYNFHCLIYINVLENNGTKLNIKYLILLYALFAVVLNSKYYNTIKNI